MAGDGKSMEDSIKRFVATLNPEFLTKHGAHAVGVGRRRKGGKRDASGDLCLVIYVEPGRKPADRNTKPAAEEILEKIPFVDPVVGKTVMIPTDVVTATVAKMSKDGHHQSTAHPAPRVAGGLGCLTRPTRNDPPQTGTIGGWAWDTTDHTFVYLSNRHVFGSKPGRIVFHPEIPPLKRLGTVKRSAYKRNGVHQVDCAIGSIDEPSRAEFSVHPVGPAIMRLTEPTEGLPLERVGLKSHRWGTLVNPQWIGDITDGRRVRRFFNCLLIEPIETDELWAVDGDSGSLVFAAEPVEDSRGVASRAVVGLHFGTTYIDGKAFGVACKIDEVFQALELMTIPDGLLHSLADEIMGDEPEDLAHGLQDERLDEKKHLVDLMIAFRDKCGETVVGRRLLRVLDGNRASLITKLVQDRTARETVAELLRVLFFGRGTIADVLAQKFTTSLISAANHAGDVLVKKVDGELAAAVEAARADLPKEPGQTLGGYLAGSR